MNMFGDGSKDELLASLETLFLPETERVFAEELVALSEGRTSFEAETVVRTLRGEMLALLYTIAFPPRPAEFSSVLVSLMDITGRKRAEEEQRYHTQLLKTVTDNASSMLYIVDGEGLGTYVNPAVERITGYQPSSGRNPTKVG